MKLNLGNYESRDFFCCAKVECQFTEADRVSEELHSWCQRQAQRAAQKYQRERDIRAGKLPAESKIK